MAKKRLDLLLVEKGLVPTRARAQARILAGDVVVGDHRVDKAGAKFDPSVKIRLKGEDMPWVSRGGLKLVGALDHFKIDVKDRFALDAGASTGGFTDVLLTRGAAHVFCVDVGHSQLDWKIRNDKRITNLERTHIVKMTPGTLDPAPDLGVVDVSFISLTRVLPAMLLQLQKACEIVALIKPQFEVGKDNLGKGGIVKDPELHRWAVERVVQAAEEHGLKQHGIIESPIQGTTGNIEFLAHFISQAKATEDSP